jgi:predicted dehydrogenase
MSRSVGIGIVGAGSISIRGLLPHLTRPDIQDRVHAAAVCDPVPGRAAAAAEKFGVPNGCETYEALLADPAVDLVTIASPIGLHFEQGMQAVEAGKHIHFNKTMTTTVNEANRLIDRAQERGVKMVASPGQMLWPINQRIRQIIRDGVLGQLSWAATGAAFGDYHQKERVREGTDILSNVDPSWYYRKPGGGPMYDMTVYGLHALTGILGSARRVTAFSGVGITQRPHAGKMVPCDADDNTFLLVDFGSSLVAFVYGAFAGGLLAFGHPSFFGDKGSINGTTLNGKPIEIDGPKPGEAGYLPHVVGDHVGMEEAHVYEDVMQLVDWVREDIPPVPTVEHARHVVDIIEAGYRSSETGQAQPLTTTF